MRACVCAVLLATSIAAADDDTGIRVRRLADAQTEPWLHLNDTMMDSADAEGGVIDGRTAMLDLGPRARVAAEGKWWQSGLAPSMFAEDLHINGWRASAELSYHLGPFRLGVNASMGRVGDSSHRMVGLFAYRNFRLSRWMHAWIVLGVAFEQWDDDVGPRGPRQGVNTGLSVGTTFR